MPPRYRYQQEKRGVIGFWLIVLLICVIAGLVSYQAGKNWVGRRLAEVELERGGRPRLLRSAEEEGVSPEPSERLEAPLQPVVEIEERAATEVEKLEMELRAAAREAAEDQPQDGAELHASEEEGKTSGAEEEPGPVNG